MRKAATIAGLKEARSLTVWIDATPARCCNFWAPEFFLLDGPNGPRWYGYYTAGTVACCDNQRTHVIESAGTDPLGPYTYKGELHDSIGGWAIDASVLQLNSALYLLFSAWKGDNQNLYIAPMSDPWTVSGERVLLSWPTYAWEKQTGNVNEGPVALQRDGKAVIYSASACWGPDYKLGLLTYTGDAPGPRGLDQSGATRLPRRMPTGSSRRGTIRSSSRPMGRKTGLFTRQRLGQWRVRHEPHPAHPALYLGQRLDAQFRRPGVDQRQCLFHAGESGD